jgi:hypothetical protein
MEHLTEWQRLGLHQKLYSWCWSGQTPEEYCQGRSAGLGVFAAVHPGAFNLAWVMMQRPTPREYADWLNDPLKRMRDQKFRAPDLRWIAQLSEQDFYVRELSTGNVLQYWHVFDKAFQLSYTDFMQEFTPARRIAVSKFIGYNINPYLDYA